MSLIARIIRAICGHCDRRVDVAQHLDDLARHSGEHLDWRTSIVDLMKLLGLDHSWARRSQLARELGYEGDMADSEELNTWLHKRVMEELAENGGEVPEELK